MELLTLIIVPAALVWALVFLVRGSLVAGVLAVLVGGAVFGYHFFHAELGPVPLTVDRVLVVLVAAAFLVQGFLRRTDPKPLGWPDWTLIAFAGALALSGSLAGWQGTPSEPYVAICRLINGYLIPLLLYGIVRQSPLGRRPTSLVHATLTCLGVYLAVTAILEVTGQWWAVFPRHIADPDVGLHYGRARGPMVHAVSCGLYLGTCFFAAWAYRWRFGRLGRAGLYVLLPLMLAAVACTFTRSVWLGTAAGVLIALALALPGRWRLVVPGCILAAGLLVSIVRLDALTSLRREDTAEDSRRSVSMRGAFTYVSWLMFCDRPLLGVGFGQFPTAKLPYLSDRSTDLDLESIRGYCHHNTFLSLLTESGLIGLGLYLAVLAGWAHTAWFLVRSPAAPDWARAQGLLLLSVLALYACQGMFHELTYTPIDNALVFVLAGLSVWTRATICRQETLRRQGAEVFLRPVANSLLPRGI